FFAVSPDHRIFLTDMYNRADNSLGKIYILDGLDPETHKFSRVTIYLTHLRNPNNLAFYTHPATGQSWIYIPLTDKLIRYRYSPRTWAPTILAIASPRILSSNSIQTNSPDRSQAK